MYKFYVLTCFALIFVNFLSNAGSSASFTAVSRINSGSIDSSSDSVPDSDIGSDSGSSSDTNPVGDGRGGNGGGVVFPCNAVIVILPKLLAGRRKKSFPLTLSLSFARFFSRPLTPSHVHSLK